MADAPTSSSASTSALRRSRRRSSTRRRASTARARAAYPTRFPAPGHAEQDPHDWWRARWRRFARAASPSCRSARESHRRQSASPRRCAAPSRSTRAASRCIRASSGSTRARRRWRGRSPAVRSASAVTASCARSAGSSSRTARRISTAGPALQDPVAARALRSRAPRRALSRREGLARPSLHRPLRDDARRRAAHVAHGQPRRRARLVGPYLDALRAHARRAARDRRARGGRRHADAQQPRTHLGLREGLPVSGGVSDINAAALAAGDYARRRVSPLARHEPVARGAYARAAASVPRAASRRCARRIADRYLLVAAQESAGAAVRGPRRLSATARRSALQALDADAAQRGPGRGHAALRAVAFRRARAGERREARAARSLGASLRTTPGRISRTRCSPASRSTRAGRSPSASAASPHRLRSRYACTAAAPRSARMAADRRRHAPAAAAGDRIARIRRRARRRDDRGGRSRLVSRGSTKRAR